MRKLKFIAAQQDAQQNSLDTQHYVTTLLAKQLGQYGFQTQASKNPEQQLAITVQDHPVALGVRCQSGDAQGALVCEINAYADESQAWFQKIETQSMIKQLAQAVEETLKKEQGLKDFEWK